jgi:catechol-2,3-dioxygenase
VRSGQRRDGRLLLVIGRWHGLVVDTPDPRGLAAFYQELLGMQRIQDDEHWVVIGDAPDRPGLAFQLAPDLQPPQWPDPGHPQQMHLDIVVSDIEQAEKQVLALGAQRLPGQGKTFRVYIDPSGHPFCLCT